MKKGLRMYEQREKPKEKIKANRPATRLNVTNKTHKLGRIDDDFLAQQPNGLLQRQPRGRVSLMVADYFQSQSSTIQRMAVGLPAAQMLALASRLLAGLAAGVTLSKSLQALNKSSEFERMTSVQKMMVYSVLYKVANQAKPNKTETLPAAFDVNSTTGGSEITEQGATSTSQPLTDQAILDLLGPIPASDDMPLVGNTPLPIVDDLGLGRVYSQGGGNESVLKAESKALDGSTGTVVRSGAKATVVNTATTQTEGVVPDKLDDLTSVFPKGMNYDPTDGTVKIYRKMSAAEAEKTLNTGQLQSLGSRYSNQNRKYLSEDYDKTNLFVNNGYATSDDAIIEFNLDAKQYLEFRNQIIPQNGASKDLDVSPLTGNSGSARTVYNTEGLGELNGRVKVVNGVEVPQRGHGSTDGLWNLGVSSQELELFNSMLRGIKVK